LKSGIKPIRKSSYFCMKKTTTNKNWTYKLKDRQVSVLTTSSGLHKYHL